MNAIKNSISSAAHSRHYAMNYARAEQDTVLDEINFASLAEQRAFFHRKADDARRALAGELRTQRALLSAALRGAAAEEREQIEAQIAAIDAELAEISATTK